jgi:RNA polymerase sigma-70 factor (ECF subfamily)
MLAERARDGDHDAFRALYERYAPMVHAVLLASGPRGEADDLMQEVFLAAWRGLHRLRSNEHMGGWLGVIARNRGKRAFLRARPAADELAFEPADPRSERDRSDGRDAGAEATGMTHGSVRVNLSRGMTMYEELLRKRGWP